MPPPMISCPYTQCQYALTITYRDHIGDDIRFQYDSTIRLIYNILDHSCDEFMIYPELTVNGRIHYHCLCLKKNQELWQKALIRLRKECGRVKAVEARTPDDWLEYCEKDTDCMKELLGRSFPITQEHKRTEIYTPFCAPVNDMYDQIVNACRDRRLKKTLEQSMKCRDKTKRKMLDKILFAYNPNDDSVEKIGICKFLGP